MAVETVARDLAIGEEADKRDVAELFADETRLDAALAEQGGAARDATDTSGLNSIPEMPFLPRAPRSVPPATSGVSQRCETRPPTRKAPLALAVSTAACTTSGQRGSAWTSPRVGCVLSIQFWCRCGRSEPGSAVAANRRKLSGGNGASMTAAAGRS